jgi:hyperosmotically inducible protein
MKQSFIKNLANKQVLGLVLSLSVLPIVGALSGCAGDRYHQSTGEAIDDKGISMRVSSALSGDSQYKYEGVQVKTFKGTVQLSGFVDTQAQKSRAAELAKNVEGVRDLDNNITVK